MEVLQKTEFLSPYKVVGLIVETDENLNSFLIHIYPCSDAFMTHCIKASLPATIPILMNELKIVICKQMKTKSGI